MAMPKIFSSLRSRLMLVGILAILPALGLMLHTSLEARHSTTLCNWQSLPPPTRIP